MTIEAIKPKIKKFNNEKKVNNLSLIDCGYDDFKYVEPIKSWRVKDGYNIHFVCSGKGYLFIGDKRFVINAKEVFMIPANVSVCYYPSESNPWSYYWINATGLEMERLNKEMMFSKECPVKKIKNNEEIEGMFQAMFTYQLSQKEVEYKAISILYNITSGLLSNDTKTTFIKESNMKSRVENLIKLNYKNPNFSAKFLVDILHISHTYISKLYKEQSGTTIMKALTDFRLEKAVSILKEGDILVKDLSSEVGFKSELLLMREFKKKYNKTIREYIRDFKNSKMKL